MQPCGINYHKKLCTSQENNKNMFIRLFTASSKTFSVSLQLCFTLHLLGSGKTVFMCYQRAKQTHLWEGLLVHIVTSHRIFFHFFLTYSKTEEGGALSLLRDLFEKLHNQTPGNKAGHMIYVYFFKVPVYTI